MRSWFLPSCGTGRAVLACACVLSTACGGTDGDLQGAETPPIEQRDPCVAAEELELDFIENFEFRRAPDWWVSIDGTPGAELEPPLRKSPTATEIDGGRCGESRYALRLQARGLHIYGGAFGINFFLGPEDGSVWEGLSFWARRGSDSGRSLFVALSDKYTDESSGAPLWEDGEPYCSDQTDVVEEKCDRFGAGVGLDTEWRHFRLPFADMRQRGFGKTAPELDTQNLLGLSFGFEVGDWDIWLDDVAFYRHGEAPTDSDDEQD